MNTRARVWTLLASLVAAMGNSAAYELTTHAKISNSAYFQSRLGSDPSFGLIYTLGLAAWTLPTDQIAPFSTASGSLYLDVTGSLVVARPATTYEDDLLRSIPDLFIDRSSVAGWIMRGAIREDDGVFPFAPWQQPQDDILRQNRFCNHFFDPIVVRPTVGRG